MSQIKTAMVLAAGIGSRMRPLTDDRPKALVEVAGRTLIDRVLDRLVEAGVETAVVNVHHFADQMEAHLAGRTDLKILISDERGELLDSGGGIKRARAMLGGEVAKGDTIRLRWDATAEQVVIEAAAKPGGDDAKAAEAAQQAAS